VRDGVVQGDPSRSFRLVTLNFMATGGDGYRFGAANAQGDGLPRLQKLDTHPRAGAALGGQVGLPPGGEQDALAEYLLQRHRTSPYAEADTPPEQDSRIQNLRRRADTVLP
jgi:hypothetical protein